ncbi:MAG: dimethylargininase [Deltaproteobacteria bacterium]|nr:dimethylargininase [Deltaproteobacteria bacterium]MBW2077072.1 dimethylargininase [Deltaproteobacteria bacterium]MBW2310239.1 dimethylargininase [Deltaproteobacteria bacterium]
MALALTHIISPDIAQCEISFIERSTIDYDLAVQQHEAYCALLRDCGLKVIELTVNSAYPDSTFIEDTAVVLDEIAVMARMGAASRRGEVPGIESVLAAYRKIDRIRPPATLEGGDVLLAGGKVFVGITPRTNVAGVSSLTAILEPFGYQVIPVTVRGCLHLKSACTAIDDETVLLNPHWIDLEPFKVFHAISVPEDEPWAANTLLVENTVCVHAGFTHTVEILHTHGFAVKTVDISELLKAEAGMTCSSIIFNDTV